MGPITVTRANGTFNHHQSINHNLGLNLTLQQYSHLKAGFEILCKKNKNEIQKTMSLRSFFGLKAAVSKIFRKVLTSKNKSKVTQLTQYKTY